MNKSTDERRKPLQGLLVLDLGIALSGPFCSQLLAGLGAAVIKIEPLPDGDRVRFNTPYLGSGGIDFSERTGDKLSLSHLNRNRNKKSITLNLKSPEGKEIFFKLARLADVLVENFSPGTTERLGISYPEVEKVNPRLVYASISGFGQEGRRRGMRAYDTIIQSLSGIMDATGFPDGPPTRIGVAMADMLAPLYATIGILAALEYRGSSGLGQHVDVSMLDSMMTFVAGECFDVYDRYNVPYRTGNVTHRMPTFGTFQAKDGYITICCLTDTEAYKLFKAMNRDELIADDRFKMTGQRVLNATQIIEIVEGWTKTRSVPDLVAELSEQGVICCPVSSVAESLRDPDLIERKAIVPLTHPLVEKPEEAMGTGMPFRFSKSPVEFDSPAPVLGQHNEEIYCELLGYSRGDMERLKEQGVV